MPIQKADSHASMLPVTSQQQGHTVKLLVFEQLLLLLLVVHDGHTFANSVAAHHSSCSLQHLLSCSILQLQLLTIFIITLTAATARAKF
jgi:hypothetical protein